MVNEYQRGYRDAITAVAFRLIKLGHPDLATTLSRELENPSGVQWSDILRNVDAGTERTESNP